jgi:hypothetical protein
MSEKKKKVVKQKKSKPNNSILLRGKYLGIYIFRGVEPVFYWLSDNFEEAVEEAKVQARKEGLKDEDEFYVVDLDTFDWISIMGDMLEEQYELEEGKERKGGVNRRPTIPPPPPPKGQGKK